MYKAEVKVMLRSAILDVQGKTVENALHSLGYDKAGHVRIGKHITLEIDAANQADAERIAREVSQKVLSNPIMEDVEVTVMEAEGHVLSPSTTLGINSAEGEHAS